MMMSESNLVSNLSGKGFYNWQNNIQKNQDFLEAIRIRCEHDIKAFAEIFFPHYCTHRWNAFHENYFKISKESAKGFRRAWASPRGSAKSVIATLIKPIHDHCYGIERFVLIISSTDPLATQKLKDIRNEVLSNDDLRVCYDINFEKRKPGETQFTLISPKHQTQFVAVGRGSQIRGIRFGPYRPTKIILDDMEHSERVYSERQREKDKAYFDEDVTKAGNEETNIEIVGTILHRSSLLSGFFKRPSYKSHKYQSITSWPERKDLWNQWEDIYMNIGDDDRLANSERFYTENRKELLKGFQVMWPDKEPPLYLMKEMMEIGRRAFMKEKQNEPLGADDKVFDNLHWYRVNDGNIVIEATGEKFPIEDIKNNYYGALDPATGQTRPSQSKMSDFACLLVGFQDSKGRVYAHEDWTKRKPPTKQINSIFDYHFKFDFQKFGVETNLYRELLLPNIMEEKKRREEKIKKVIKIPFYDIVNTENKDKRIHRLEPKASHGWILFNRNLSHEFLNQMQDYPHSDHDDCPDALEMLWNLIHNRYKAGTLAINAFRGV